MMNDYEFMKLAIKEAKKCPPSKLAYCVGCVVVKKGKVISKGYSRQENNCHGEEIALRDVPEGCSIYTTMEPCSKRNSSNSPCIRHIISKKVSKVIFGCNEPDLFQNCKGKELLEKEGIKVIQLKEFSKECLNVALSVIKKKV
jgi:tRNA pseudouridine32 synthase / 2,5-diamino-6-(5-phospho-D-ribitylamino)-pyrimidin-4(3H)-one deaminase